MRYGLGNDILEATSGPRGRGSEGLEGVEGMVFSAACISLSWFHDGFHYKCSLAETDESTGVAPYEDM